MVTRLMFRAQLKQGTEDIALIKLKNENQARQFTETKQCMTIAGYLFNRDVFLYMELIEGKLTPEHIVPTLNELLEEWPGQEQPRKWIPLIDVFHFNEPASVEHWRRKEKPDRIGGRVAYLKPEMAASYIFYHYQLQEERGFTGPKYEIIGMHENLLFGYQEFPGVVEAPISEGKLSSKQTPVPWESTRMDLHFEVWPDGHQFFKRFEAVFHSYFEYWEE